MEGLVEATVPAAAVTSPGLGTVLLSLLLPLMLILFLTPFYYIHWSRPARFAVNIAGPKPLPVIGNAHVFGKGPIEFLENITKLWIKYGNVFKMWLGHKVFIVSSKPEHLEVFLSSHTNITKTFSYKFLYAWLGTGLLTSTGSKWKEHRKMITPAFHFKILEQFADRFHDSCGILIESLQKHVGGVPFDIYEYVTLATLDIICETALGVSVDAQKNSESEYVAAVKWMENIIMERSFKPWMFFDSLFNMSKEGKMQKKCLKVLHDTTRKVIETRKQQYLKKSNDEFLDKDIVGQKKKLALLDILLECSRNGGNLTDEDIREEVDTFMFEGHDTTASGITFCLWLLGTHLDIQEKVFREIQDILGDSEQKTTFRNLQDMKYLDCVTKEALRLFPSVPFYGRELSEDVKLGDTLLSAGTSVVFAAYFLHRDPELYPDPEIFDPDRFLPERIQGRHPYSYLPFSAGPRNCIGQKFAMLEMKSVISEIVRNYKVISNKDEPLTLSSEVVLRGQPGVFMKIEKR